MVRNVKQYQRAIALRRRGYSYSEILANVPVTKSTLSLWLRSVALSTRSQHVLSEKKRLASLRGARARHIQRVRTQNAIFADCHGEIQHLTDRERWLVGIALYWAEGSKEKEDRPGSGVKFSNSDPMMIRFFVQWLRKSVRVPVADVAYDLYIHSEAIHRRDEICNYWRTIEGLVGISFGRVYVKKGNSKTLRKNRGNAYYGLARVRVRASSRLTRQLAGWAAAIAQN